MKKTVIQKTVQEQLTSLCLDYDLNRKKSLFEFENGSIRYGHRLLVVYSNDPQKARTFSQNVISSLINDNINGSIRTLTFSKGIINLIADRPRQKVGKVVWNENDKAVIRQLIDDLQKSDDSAQDGTVLRYLNDLMAEIEEADRERYAKKMKKLIEKAHARILETEMQRTKNGFSKNGKMIRFRR